jgi:hypothetical protein
MDCCDTLFFVTDLGEPATASTKVKARFPTDAVRMVTGWTGPLRQETLDNGGVAEVYRVRGDVNGAKLDMLTTVLDD